MKSSGIAHIALLKELTDIGVALSTEKDYTRLLEMILRKAKELTNADGATLYECTDDKCLDFKIMLNDSQGIYSGGKSDHKIPFESLPMFDKNGNPNVNLVATCVATSKNTINIEDVYKETRFDFSDVHNWDKQIGYHSKSFLTVPMTNHLNEVIGVLQLINARSRNGETIVAFSKLDQQIVESLASQAAVSITNRNLIDAQKKLFDSLIQLIATSIDEKSPYTAGHCRRVPVITKLLADAACRIDTGPLKNFSLSDEEMYELEVAAWLHDCGKITTPEYVVDKATKLETIFDRIHLIDMRFEILKRDAVIKSLSDRLKKGGISGAYIDKDLQQCLDKFDEDRVFLHECNVGKESIGDADIANILRIASYSYMTSSETREPFLSEEEVQNLKIYRGTLSVRERFIINNHVKVSAQMLESLPYPKNLQRVPEFASCHHERMDGKGYPKGLKGEQMPIQCRIIAIADVFEALSASDRPYKQAMPLSQCLAILGEMKLSGHIDPDLFDVFMHEKIYLTYAEQYLDKQSIDDIDVTKIPGYAPLPV